MLIKSPSASTSNFDLVLVRHGAHERTGWLVADDAPLSEEGVRQAHALARQIGPRQINSLFSSPRRRALETAEILGRHLGVEPVVRHELKSLPLGPAVLLSPLQIALFVRNQLCGGTTRVPVIVVTHWATILLLLIIMGEWRQVAGLIRRTPFCRPIYCRCNYPKSFVGPVLLLFMGMGLGTLFAPGPMPPIWTSLSYISVLAIYLLVSRLALHGHAKSIVALLVLIGLLLVPLAFGPSPLTNRKVTPYNEWAYTLASRLPAIVSPAPNPNAVAIVLVACLALAGAALCMSRDRKKSLPWMLILSLLLAGSLVLTASRAGWLAGAAALGLLIVLYRPGLRANLIIVSAIALFAILVIASSLMSGPTRLSVISTESMGMRLEQWQLTAGLLSRSPITGLGTARFPYAYAEAARESGLRPYKTPNNALLQVWADAGMLGVIAFGWAAIRAGKLCRAGLRRGGPSSWLFAGIAAALLGMGTHGMFEANLSVVWALREGYGHLASPLPFVLLGLLAGLSQRYEVVMNR